MDLFRPAESPTGLEQPVLGGLGQRALAQESPRVLAIAAAGEVLARVNRVEAVPGAGA